jgi:glutathione S-transferase
MTAGRATAKTNDWDFIDLAAAREHAGLVLVVSGLVPSPWSEAAKGIAHVKGLSAVLLRGKPRDPELEAWTHSHNVPVAMYPNEPPRTGWAEILMLSERLSDRSPLVPADPEQRCKLFGLAHEIAGEGGLGWCARLLTIHGSLSTEGARGFPLRAAHYLARKYGYAPERVAAARAKVSSVMATLAAELARSQARGGDYLLGDTPSALDIYWATFSVLLVGASEADCPAMPAELRPIFSYLREDLGLEAPSPLLAHRALMYSRHLPWPLQV